jgi:hypothetical protein
VERVLTRRDVRLLGLSTHVVSLSRLTRPSTSFPPKPPRSGYRARVSGALSAPAPAPHVVTRRSAPFGPVSTPVSVPSLTRPAPPSSLSPSSTPPSFLSSSNSFSRSGTPPNPRSTSRFRLSRPPFPPMGPSPSPSPISLPDSCSTGSRPRGPTRCARCTRTCPARGSPPIGSGPARACWAVWRRGSGCG